MIAPPVACVVDASVGIKLVIAEALSAEARALFAHLARDPAAKFYVPDLFDIECANILWKYIQRASYPVAEARKSLSLLTALSLRRLPVTALAADALPVAAGWGITAYDACHVVAAERLNVPLITADSKLVAKLAGTHYRIAGLGQLTILPPP